MEKKRKPKRLTKAELEKRAQILSQILDKWVCVRNDYAHEEEYMYLKHFLLNEKKITRIGQILISGYPEQDGVYEISDYDIGYYVNPIEREKKVELKPIKFDLKFGIYAETDFVDTYEEMLQELVKRGHATQRELNAMLKGRAFHKNLDEIVQTYVSNNRKRDVN